MLASTPRTSRTWHACVQDPVARALSAYNMDSGPPGVRAGTACARRCRMWMTNLNTAAAHRGFAQTLPCSWWTGSPAQARSAAAAARPDAATRADGQQGWAQRSYTAVALWLSPEARRLTDVSRCLLAWEVRGCGGEGAARRTFGGGVLREGLGGLGGVLAAVDKHHRLVAVLQRRGGALVRDVRHQQRSLEHVLLRHADERHRERDRAVLRPEVEHAAWAHAEELADILVVGQRRREADDADHLLRRFHLYPRNSRNWHEHLRRHGREKEVAVNVPAAMPSGQGVPEV